MKKQAEADFAEKKTELEQLTRELDEKERDNKELSHSFEQFQRRYSSLVGHKQVELNRLNAELADVVASKSGYGNKVNPQSSGGGNPFAGSVAAGKDVTVRARSESYSIKELQALCVNIDVASNKEVNYGVFKSSDVRSPMC